MAGGFPGAQRPLMLSYWGTRGGTTRLSLELARFAAAQNEIRCTFAVSRSNELFDQLSFLGDDLFAADTFKHKWQFATAFRQIAALRSRLKERLTNDKTRAVVSLMPHVWWPFIAPVIRQAGARHVVIVHDADPHPGDRYALANWWLLRESAKADHVVTLSRSVAQRLVAARGIPESKITVLFHPELDYGRTFDEGVNKDGPLRILFLGRIMPYKGLRRLIDAVEILRGDGVPLKLGVFGPGKIEPALGRRLATAGAEVVNRWLHDDEFKTIFKRHDVVIAAHSQASQSGVVAAAFGAGVPVIATPVGGLVEQVIPGVTGVIADAVTPQALATAIRSVAENRALLDQLRQGIAATRGTRSIERFFGKLCAITLGADAGGKPVASNLFEHGRKWAAWDRSEMSVDSHPISTANAF